MVSVAVFGLLDPGIQEGIKGIRFERQVEGTQDWVVMFLMIPQ